jgi:hypothetical protein
MEFHFVKLNVNGTYLRLVDPSSKPRYMCFAEKPVADQCVQYVADFRSRHGIWPSFDMSSSNRKIETKLDAKPRTPEQVSRYLELETYDFHTIDEIASRANVSFYCVLRFDTEATGTRESVSMSGQEMDGDASPDKYVEWMNFNLKIK